MNLKDWIRDIPDFPKKGILFRDLTPLLAHPPAFRDAVERITGTYRDQSIDAVAAIDARLPVRGTRGAGPRSALDTA